MTLGFGLALYIAIGAMYSTMRMLFFPEIVTYIRRYYKANDISINPIPLMWVGGVVGWPLSIVRFALILIGVKIDQLLQKLLKW